MKKWWIGLMVVFFALFTLASVVRAAGPEQEQEHPECLPDDGFNRYQYVAPTLLMPDVEQTEAVAVWNFQCPHATSVDVVDQQGQVIATIIRSTSYGNGENTVNWNGLDNNGKPVPNGVYTIRITPQDEFREYAIEVNVTIKLFKYPTLYGIFGEPLKNQVKSLP